MEKNQKNSFGYYEAKDYNPFVYIERGMKGEKKNSSKKKKETPTNI